MRTEAELENVMNQLREEESRDKYLRTLATVPAMLLGAQPPVFVDRNGIIPDPMAAERERKQINPWTEEEKVIFLKNFVLYPKQFSKIATFLENKATSDVIWYYYTNKKTLDLKKVLRDHTGATKRRSYNRKPVFTGPPGTPRELRDLIMEEQNRPTLLLPASPLATTIPSSKDNSVGDADTRWTDPERELFIEAIAKYAKDFKAIAQHLGTKNMFQCRNFYHNFKRRHGFDEIIEEGVKKREAKAAQKTPTKDKTDKTEKRTKVEKQDKQEKTEKLNDEKAEKRAVAQWTGEERSLFIKYFAVYGRQWEQVADHIPSKTVPQVKNFFQNYKHKLKLNDLLPTDESPTEKKRSRKNKVTHTRTLLILLFRRTSQINVRNPKRRVNPVLQHHLARSRKKRKKRMTIMKMTMTRMMNTMNLILPNAQQ